MKRESKRRKFSVYISDDSWIVMDTWSHIHKHKLVVMVWYSN